MHHCKQGQSSQGGSTTESWESRGTQAGGINGGGAVRLVCDMVSGEIVEILVDDAGHVPSLSSVQVLDH